MMAVMMIYGYTGTRNFIWSKQQAQWEAEKEEEVNDGEPIKVEISERRRKRRIETQLCATPPVTIREEPLPKQTNKQTNKTNSVALNPQGNYTD
jgi:hypothetical protein